MEYETKIGAYLNPEHDVYLESKYSAFKINAGSSLVIDIDKEFRHCGVFRLEGNSGIDTKETTIEVFEGYYNIAKEKLGLAVLLSVTDKNTNTGNYNKAKELIELSKTCPDEIVNILAKKIEELLSNKDD